MYVSKDDWYCWTDDREKQFYSEEIEVTVEEARQIRAAIRAFGRAQDLIAEKLGGDDR